jgi:hypothetical protein
VSVIADRQVADDPGPPSEVGSSGAGAPDGRPGWLRLLTQRKVVAWTVFFVALVAYVLVFGIPYSTDEILIWITAALFCASISDLGRWRRGLIRDWLPLYAVLAFYSLLRGYASHLWFAAHWSPQTRFDQWVGFGTAPTVRLQNALFNPNNLHVWDYLAWCTYMTHFFASFVIAGVLWVKDHDRFRRFVPLFVGLTFAGYLTYVLYPAMPPWMVSANGSMAPSVRIIPVMWNHVGFHQAAALFEGNASFDNDVAAVPSLHSAYPMLICLFFWGRASRWLRVLLVTYVVAMASTLVYTGEHFVFDIILGWTYAILTFVIGSRLLDRRDARKAARLAMAAGGDPPSGQSAPSDSGNPEPDDPATVADAARHLSPSADR